MRGTGTQSNPLIIEFPQDLITVSTTHLQATKYIKLGNDIDMSGIKGFVPIGSYSSSSVRFRGKFDGAGFAVRNLTVESSSIFVGLFGYIESGAIVSNLSIIDATIIGTGTNSNVGILAGDMAGNVSKIFTSGTVTNTTGSRSAGIVGVIASAGNLSDSFSVAHITGGRSSIAGLVGRVEHSRSEGIKNCYFAGIIKPTATATSIGGAVASPTGTEYKFPNVYYNSDLITDYDLIEFDTPLTTAQMKIPSSFSNYSTNIWTVEEGKYPYITSLGEPVIVIPAQNVVVNATSYLESFTSNSKLIKRKLETSLTFSHPIVSSVHRELVASSMSIVEAITSSAEVMAIIVANTKTYTVTSTLSELVGSSTRVAKAIRGIDSHIDLFGSEVTVTIPEEVEKPIYATVHFKLSQSMTNTKYSESIAEYLSHQSDTQITTNRSNTNLRENAIEMSVI